MDLSENQSSLKNAVKLALQAAITDAESQASASEAPVDRLLAIEENRVNSNSYEETAPLDPVPTPGVAGSLTLHVNSQGLSLDQKIAVEKGFFAALAELKKNTETTWPERILLNFRRVATGVTNDPSSVPSTPKSAPGLRRQSAFGLKIDKRAIPGVRSVIVVASGKGGVGKSTVSVNLATSLAQQSLRVGLLDADIYGPSAPTMFGLRASPEVGPGNMIAPPAAHGVKIMSFGFLSDAYNPVIWRGPMVAKAIEQLLYNVSWGELDYLIVDLPPGTGDVQLTLIEKLPIHGAIIVTTPQDVALVDAHKALTMFEKLEVPVLGVVENMSTYHCPNCGHENEIFGAAALELFLRERKIPRLVRIPLHREVREAGDSGSPVVIDKAASSAGTAFKSLADFVVKH